MDLFVTSDKEIHVNLCELAIYCNANLINVEGGLFQITKIQV